MATGRECTRWAPFLVVLAISLPILFAPAPTVPAAATGVDKVVHVALFAALAGTALLPSPSIPARLALVAGALLGYAAVSEIVQALPAIGRTTSLTDWLADAAGVLLGLFVVRGLRTVSEGAA